MIWFWTVSRKISPDKVSKQLCKYPRMQIQIPVAGQLQLSFAWTFHYTRHKLQRDAAWFYRPLCWTGNKCLLKCRMSGRMFKTVFILHSFTFIKRLAPSTTNDNLNIYTHSPSIFTPIKEINDSVLSIICTTRMDWLWLFFEQLYP